MTVAAFDVPPIKYQPPPVITAHGTLTPNQVTWIILEYGWAGFVVVNRGVDGVYSEGNIWCRIDGFDPVPEQPASFVVLGARTFQVQQRRRQYPTPVNVKLISDRALKYSVEVVS